MYKYEIGSNEDDFRRRGARVARMPADQESALGNIKDDAVLDRPSARVGTAPEPKGERLMLATG